MRPVPRWAISLLPATEVAREVEFCFTATEVGRALRLQGKELREMSALGLLHPRTYSDPGLVRFQMRFRAADVVAFARASGYRVNITRLPLEVQREWTDQLDSAHARGEL